MRDRDEDDIGRMMGMLNDHPVPHMIIKGDAEVVFANTALYSLLGHSPQEVSTSDEFYLKVFPNDEYHERVTRRFNMARQRSGGKKIFQAKMACNDGSSRQMRFMIMPMNDEHTLVALLDVTRERSRMDLINRERHRQRLLLELSEINDATQSEVFDFGLHKVLEVTGAQFGYIFLHDEGEGLLRLLSYSTNTHDECNVMNAPMEFKVGTSGLWAEPVRQQMPIIINDYHQTHPLKRGLPTGHVPIHNHMGIPLMDRGKVVGVIGAANKDGYFNKRDVRNVQLLMDGVWKIAKRREAEDALQESELRFRDIVENINEVVYLVSKGDVLYINPVVEDLLGLGHETMMDDVDAIYGIIHPDDKKRVQRANEMSKDQSKQFDQEFRIIHPEKGERWVRVRTFIIDSDLARSAGVIEDVTDRRLMEEELRNSLEEKTTLLQEVHHRVRNNLQLVNSLIALQLTREETKEVRSALQDAENRIMTMASVHESLYRSKNVANVDADDHFHRLVSGLVDTFRPDDKVSVRVVAPDIVMDLSLSIPVSLVVNELVTNSLKYAFPKGDKGTIDVSMVQEGHGYRLWVGDDGVGLPDGFSPTSSNTLGMRLVRTIITRQLGGTLKLLDGQGTKWEITIFPPGDD